ncbi:hypothetical protein IAR50_007022 [Cryptococcus sp. DSM 104548]
MPRVRARPSDTPIFQTPQNYFSYGEYSNADSNYTPNVNCVPSYKSNSGDHDGVAQDHAEFNDLVKKVQVRVERATGYWKARFQKLQLLSSQVKTPKKYVKVVSIWIAVTALLHNWVLEHEGLNDEDLTDAAELEGVMLKEVAAQERLKQSDIQESDEVELQGDRERREAVRRETELMKERRGQNVAYVEADDSSSG